MELVLILGMFLVLFGPKELPGLARGVLKALNEMKHIFYSLQKEWGLSSEGAPEALSSPPSSDSSPPKKNPPSKRDSLKPLP